MSAGRFTIRFYEADSAETHLMLQQPETAGLIVDTTANTVPEGPASSPFWAKVGRGATEYGLRPRKLRGRFSPGQAPEGYKEESTFDVVIYKKSVYDSATIGLACTYLGASGQIIAKIREDIYPAI